MFKYIFWVKKRIVAMTMKHVLKEMKSDINLNYSASIRDARSLSLDFLPRGDNVDG